MSLIRGIFPQVADSVHGYKRLSALLKWHIHAKARNTLF